MRIKIDAWDIYGDIRLSRSTYSGTFVIVEGIKDGLLFENFFNIDVCVILVAKNKNNVLDAMELLSRDEFEGVLAILDNDYWFLEGRIIGDPNILLTDLHDTETMIINSEALERVLREYSDPTTFLRFLRDQRTDIRTILLENAKYIGYLRWYSHKNKISAITVKNLKYNRIFDINQLTLDLKKLIDESLIMKCKRWINKKSDIQDIIDLIEEKLNEIDARAFDLWHICAGHDIVKILGIGIKNIFGKSFARNTSEDELERSLRLAYGIDLFRNTDLYQSITLWENMNAGYIIIDR